MEYTGPVQFRLFRFNKNDSYYSYFTNENPLLVGTIPQHDIGRRDYRLIIRTLNKELDSLLFRLDHDSKIHGVLFLFSTGSMDPETLAKNVLSDKIYIREIDFYAIFDILRPYAIYPFYSSR